MACCGRVSPGQKKKAVDADQGPVVYDTNLKALNGRCPVCRQKGKSFITVRDGIQIRVWACRRGHLSPT